MSSSAEGIYFPGQIATETINIITHSGKVYDIKAMAGLISIYEDIFSHVMSGTMVIEDGIDLLYNLPLIGQEFLDLEFITPSLAKEETFKKRFYIYKISDIDISHANSQRYVIHFISYEAIQDINLRYSQSWSGRISSNISRLITEKRYLDSDKKIALEETSNSLSFISNYWSPFEIISYMTHRGLSTDNNHPSFLFFESNKSFNFTSLQTLLNSKVYCDYNYSKVTRLPSSVGSDKATAENMKKVLKLEYSKAFDYIERANGGMHSSALVTHNLLTKTIKTVKFDYLKYWDKKNHAEAYPIVSDQITKTIYSSLSFRDNIHYVYGNQISDKFQFWLLQRRSILSQINAITMNIEVHGRTDIEVGKVINLTLPINAPTSVGETDVNNKYLSGKYLITSINHRIHNGRHRMNMNIAKESFSKEIAK